MPVLIIAAAIAAAQMYQAEKARGANQDQLDKMRADFDALIPPGMNMKITDPPELIQQRVADPQFSNEALTPEQFKVAAQYQPQIAQQVAEKNPELVKGTAASDEGRQAQLSALRQLRGIGASDFDPQFQQAMLAASRKAQGDAQSRQASILQDMQRRGVANSGLTAALQQGATADAMDREAQVGQAAAAQAYQNRINAIRQSAQLGGDINSQEMSLQAKNADIINSFNQRMAQNQQAWQNQRAGDLNQASMFNIKNAQDIANRNTAQNNEFEVNERNRADKLAQMRYDRDIQERNYQNDLAQRKADWIENQRRYLNGLRQQGFQNQLSIQQGKNGLASQQMGMNTQNAADRNSMIQGLGQVGMGYYQDQRDDARWHEQQKREDDRWKMRYGNPDDDDETNENYGGGDYHDYSTTG